jgi:hypothetical protein
MGEFEILPTDRLFPDSPDAGEADCLCSRCGKVIGEGVGVPIRAFVDDGRGGEYRYHPVCLGSDPDDDDFDGDAWAFDEDEDE